MMSDSVRTLIEQMRKMSDGIDNADNATDYQVRLIGLGLTAREFLRRHSAALAAVPPPTLLDKAIAARDERPWDFYRLEHDDMKRMLNQLADERNALRQRLAALAAVETQQALYENAQCITCATHLDEAAVETPQAQDGLLHPVSQVYFRAGLIACREYMARFVEAQDPSIANSIRANWWPSLGQDYGPPRKNTFQELTTGEYGTDAFRCLTAEDVSPTLEALPIAFGFLESGAVARETPPAPSPTVSPAQEREP